MKKIMLTIVGVLCLLVIVLLVRAQWKFSDRQYEVSQPLTPVELNSRAMIERFANAIRFETVSHDDRHQFDAQAFNQFRVYLQRAFPRVFRALTHEVVNGHSLVLHLAGSDPNLKPALFMGHYDVVPVDAATRDQWRYPPFSGAIAHEAVWGRGSMDDKVTVMALLEAVDLLLKHNISPQRSLYFAFGHDEEVGGEEGARQVAQLFESRDIEFEFVLDEGGAITQGMLVDITRPVAIIGVAEKGYVNLRLSVTAAGGHSSQPPVHTAAGILSQAIVKLEKNQFPATTRFLYQTIEQVGHYAPMKIRLPMANLWLFEPLIAGTADSDPKTAASMRTTIATTMLEGSSKSNILPTVASAVVNFRLLPGETVETLKAHVKQAIDDERVKLQVTTAHSPSSVSPTDSYGYKLIEQTIRRLNDEILVAPYLVQGGTDAKHFSGLSDNIYRFMMVRLDSQSMKQFHGVNEHMPIEDYLNAIQFYYAMLKQTALNTQPQ